LVKSKFEFQPITNHQSPITNMRIHSFTDDALGNLDATGIAELVKNKELQAKEVVAAAIERAKKVNPEINAIVTDCFDKALANADQHTEGFFAGTPIFFKDMTGVAGMPDYYGTKAFDGAKPVKKNDPISNQILAQGFVNLGTSTMPEGHWWLRVWCHLHTRQMAVGRRGFRRHVVVWWA